MFLTVGCVLQDMKSIQYTLDIATGKWKKWTLYNTETMWGVQYGGEEKKKETGSCSVLLFFAEWLNHTSYF